MNINEKQLIRASARVGRDRVTGASRQLAELKRHFTGLRHAREALADAALPPEQIVELRCKLMQSFRTGMDTWFRLVGYPKEATSRENAKRPALPVQSTPSLVVDVPDTPQNNYTPSESASEPQSENP